MSNSNTILKTFLREIVYGGTDGIITTFSVVAGYSGAQLGGLNSISPYLIVLLFGSANLISDAASMGLGNFLSTQADQELYLGERERLLGSGSIRKLPQTLSALFAKEGYTTIQSNEIANIITLNRNYAVELILEDRLSIPNPMKENPLLTGLATFIAFLIFGSIPLLPFLLEGLPGSRFALSALATATALTLLGLLRWKVTQRKPFRALAETLLLGGSASLLAYGVGTLFK